MKMPFKEIELKDLAKTMNVSLEEVQEKQRLINKIIALRLQKDLSQVQFAKMVGVTQSRIAQIESGVGTRTVSFDVLFHLLQTLGYRVEVRLKKIAV
jgi:predicted XRE-type DNA-binding protein